MRRLLLASAAFLTAAPAMAADMPVKAPVPCCGDPWVGFYVGGNAGYSWGNVSTTASVAPFLQTNFLHTNFQAEPVLHRRIPMVLLPAAKPDMFGAWHLTGLLESKEIISGQESNAPRLAASVALLPTARLGIVPTLTSPA